MARVKITEIQPGDNLTISSMNTTIESWRKNTDADGHTGTISEQNIRDGGIDQRNFQSNIVHGSVNISTYYYQYPASPNSVFSPSISSGTSQLLVSKIGPFTYVKDGIAERKYIIRLNMEYEASPSTLAQVVETSGSTWTLRYQIAWVGVSGTLHRIPETLREIQIQFKHFEYDNARGSTGLTYIFEPNSHSFVDGQSTQFYICIGQDGNTVPIGPKFVISQISFHAQRYDR